MTDTNLSDIKDVAKDKVIEAKNAATSKSSLSGLVSFLSGGFGGICAVVVGHPFDLVKVRLQTSSSYSGALDVVRKTIKRDGPTGLYAGVSAPLVGVTPMFAISFWGYDLGKGIVKRVANVEDATKFTIPQLAAAGFISAIPTTAVTAPFERVKVLLQIQGDSKKYSGGVDVIRQLYKEGGLRSVFKGSVATLARDGPGSAAYFATYEIIKRRLSKEGELSMGAIMLAGGTAGMSMWLLVFPLDTIKSQLQSGDSNTSLSKVIKGTYAKAGIKGFFPGIGPALARAYPANAATFLGVEVAQKALTKLIATE